MKETKRRNVLAGIGGVTVGSVALGATVGARRGDSDDESEYPPEGITQWGESIELGEGAVSTFASTTPSGIPTAVGIHFAAGTFEGLPYAEDFENGDAEGVKVHGFWSKPFSLDFPDNAPEPITFAGCGWNPQGHPPEGVYDRPHFDLHYYFYEPDTIADIELGFIESLPDEKVPEGYRLIEGGVVVPKMGAHMAPADAPEFAGEEWKETLIWGAADVDGDDGYELNFVEPMVTLDYFENHLEGVDRQAIAQPEVYPKEGHYPTTYTVRELGDGGHAVVLEDFVERTG